MNTNKALSGKTILITRPREQAEVLSSLIREAGGNPLVFPAVEIMPPNDSARLNELMARLQNFDLAIFISPTAVKHGWESITSAGGWPKNLPVAAIGQASARALTELGFKNIIVPTSQSDSEALLAMPELLEVTGKRIVIFRGEGGRELLAQTLSQRGALVEYAECYRRAKPDADFGTLLQQQGKPSAIVLTSREILANFRELVGNAWPQIKVLPVFVPHERIAAACTEAGMDSVQISHGGDAGMTQAMIKFFQP